jgi:predicted acylesterase/phospholipase RssA
MLIRLKISRFNNHQSLKKWYETLPPQTPASSIPKRTLALLLSSPPPQPTVEELQISEHSHLSLAIEGGGMRGSITAGMATAIHTLGYDAESGVFDSVYGSSAGALIGAYYVTGDLKGGGRIYYDELSDGEKKEKKEKKVSHLS